jgi:hypothetical protein
VNVGNVSSVCNNSVKFTGNAASRIDLGNGFNVPPKSFTFMAWVKFYNDSVLTHNTIISKHKVANTDGSWLFQFLDRHLKMYITSDLSVPYSITSTTSISGTNRNHVASTPLSVNVKNSNMEVAMATHLSSNGWPTVERNNLILDETAILNVPLTQTQIQQYMNGIPSSVSGVLGYWKFNDENDAIVKNENPLAANGTIVGAVLRSEEKPTAIQNSTTCPSLDDCAPRNGLQAYFPFNGNANDESGNGNNGIDYMPSFSTSDRQNYVSKAVSFTGNNFITVNNLSSGYFLKKVPFFDFDRI